MPYQIRKKKSVEKNLRKVAREQINKAIGEIEEKQLDRHETVHQVRKRCKKMRGMIRLVRPGFADYSKENCFLRDMARDLSFVRDAQSMIESLDMLADHFQSHVDQNVFSTVRYKLVERRRNVTENTALIEEKLDIFLSKLKELRHRSEQWHIKDDGFSAVAGGMRKTYRRGRKAMVEAYDEPSVENFHEWRKRVKYHWYHLRLLRRIWPEMVKVQHKTADELANLLGDDHDLAVLRRTLKDDIARFGGKKRMNLLFALIDRRRRELQTSANPLGNRLFAENDKQLAQRLGSYWATWQAT